MLSTGHKRAAPRRTRVTLIVALEPVTPSKRKGAPAAEEPTDLVRIGDETRLLSGDFDLGPGDTLGDYLIETLIGRGGMGDVFAGVHPKIGKRVAIKVLKKELCDEFNVQRFVDEARIVNEIGHPNIIDIFAFGDMPDGRSYFVMELLVGQTLRERIAQGPIPAVEVCTLLKPLTRALAAAHAKGVIHRDLKPDNIFLVDIPGEPSKVKLLDFGIAKLAKSDHRVEQTKSGVMVGTPQYIAPEQAKGRTVDYRADIYALGGIAFEMLTGRPPFIADNAMEMVAKHLMEVAAKPSSIVPGVPADLDTLVVTMLGKEPDQRPALAEVALVIERVIERRPVSLEDAPTGSQPIVRRLPTPLPIPTPAAMTPPSGISMPGAAMPAAITAQPVRVATPATGVALSDLYAVEPRSGAHTSVEPLPPMVSPIPVPEPTDYVANVTSSRSKYILLGVILVGAAMLLSFIVITWLRSGPIPPIESHGSASDTNATAVAVEPADAEVDPGIAIEPDAGTTTASDTASTIAVAPAIIADAAPTIVDAAPAIVADAAPAPAVDAAIAPPHVTRPPPRPPERPVIRRGHLVIDVKNASTGMTIRLDGVLIATNRNTVKIPVDLGKRYHVQISSPARVGAELYVTPKDKTTHRSVKLELNLMQPGGGR